jgi:hypothetical protein
MLLPICYLHDLPNSHEVSIATPKVTWGNKPKVHNHKGPDPDGGAQRLQIPFYPHDLPIKNIVVVFLEYMSIYRVIIYT